MKNKQSIEIICYVFGIIFTLIYCLINEYSFSSGIPLLFIISSVMFVDILVNKLSIGWIIYFIFYCIWFVWSMSLDNNQEFLKNQNILSLFIKFAFIFVLLGYLFNGLYRSIVKIASNPIPKTNPKNTILSTTIIDSITKYQTKSSFLRTFARAEIGASLWGDAGAFVGAATTPKKMKPKETKISFLITYIDGHTKVESVKMNSRRYKQLMRYIEK